MNLSRPAERSATRDRPPPLVAARPYIGSSNVLSCALSLFVINISRRGQNLPDAPPPPEDRERSSPLFVSCLSSSKSSPFHPSLAYDTLLSTNNWLLPARIHFSPPSSAHKERKPTLTCQLPLSLSLSFSASRRSNSEPLFGFLSLSSPSVP